MFKKNLNACILDCFESIYIKENLINLLNPSSHTK